MTGQQQDFSPVIASKNVRVGDRIRVEYMSGPVEYVRTGVVVALTAEGTALAEDDRILWSATQQGTITLLDRLAPVLPSEPGSVIIATIHRTTGVLLVLDDTDDPSWWSAVRVTTPTGPARWHSPQDITEWTHAKVVPLEQELVADPEPFHFDPIPGVGIECPCGSCDKRRMADTDRG